MTIIFAPIAFLTALFALDIQGLEKLRVRTVNNNDQSASSTAIADGSARDALIFNVNVSNDDDVYDNSKLFGMFCKYNS